MGINVASSANGGTVTASSTVNASYPAEAAINGLRAVGTEWGNITGGWNDDGTLPSWLEVEFNSTYKINQIDVITLQDAYNSPSTETLDMTFTAYGITDFVVEYWDGDSWEQVGSAVSNNKVWRQFTFPTVTTNKIRLYITGASGGYSRVVELEAWTATDVGKISGLSVNDIKAISGSLFSDIDNVDGLA
jgi:hypothetical protein